MTDAADTPTPRAQSRPRPAVFLDRDGVLNVDHGYTYKPEHLEFMPTAATAVRLLNEAGYYVFVVSNQSGVARGFYPEAAVQAFNTHLQDALLRDGTHIDTFYYCPHHPNGKIKELAIRCTCRKPQPGMLEQAAREWPIDRGRSFLVGDKDDDVAAAHAFGIRGIKFDAAAGTLADLVRKEITPGAD
jgi:D-glycero-D-manno-heptose 1,7-bisphosphate phosphatase